MSRLCQETGLRISYVKIMSWQNIKKAQRHEGATA